MIPETDIVFLDIPTTRGAPVSPYTWRVRLFLNHRGFHYETRWIHTVDIEAECRALNIPPTGVRPTGEPLFTLPAILDYTFSPSKPTVISDSFYILRYLERQYPSPTHPIFPAHLEMRWTSFNKFVDTQIIIVAGSLFMNDLAWSKLPRDLGPFRSRMETLFGRKWETLALKGAQREAVWKKLESNLSLLFEIFETDEKQCFMAGDVVSYPDFILCACFIWLKNIISDGDWERISAWHGGRWRKLLRMFEVLTSVDHHPHPASYASSSCRSRDTSPSDSLNSRQ